MKTLISIVAFVVVTAWVPTLRAASSMSEQAQSSPTLIWNRIALEAVERAKPTQHQAMRLLAYVSLAQYAALAEAESEHVSGDAIATASMRIIAGLISSQAAFVEGRHRQLLPRAGDEGRSVAQRLLAEAHTDGFAQTWSGHPPQAAHAWRSLVNPPAPPAYPAVGSMRTFLLDSGSIYRSAPPPAPGSTRFRDDLAEVRQHTESPTAESARIAKFYDMTTGTLVAGFWNERATALIRGNTLGEREAALILATMNAAMMDAIVACHDAKYAYWVPRPAQADPSIRPLIGVPNHPSYPSNHSCVSTAAALALAHFFPQDRGQLEAIAAEAGESRIYGGLHYRFDVEAGEEIGRKVAAVAVARHADMLARWTRTLVAEYDALKTVVPARGVQIYECRARKEQPGEYEWVFVAPEADLFDVSGNRIGRHYGGPHWESTDGSKIVGTLKERADAPVADAIPWLLLATKSVGSEGSFSKVTSIQRVNTVGGVAPQGGCSQTAAGAPARIHYTADYYFYTAR